MATDQHVTWEEARRHYWDRQVEKARSVAASGGDRFQIVDIINEADRAGVSDEVMDRLYAIVDGD